MCCFFVVVVVGCVFFFPFLHSCLAELRERPKKKRKRKRQINIDNKKAVPFLFCFVLQSLCVLEEERAAPADSFDRPPRLSTHDAHVKLSQLWLRSQHTTITTQRNKRKVRVKKKIKKRKEIKKEKGKKNLYAN